MASAPNAPFPSHDVPRHGGQLSAAGAAFPHAPKPWLDLSTGISPWAWNGPRADRAALRRLPDPGDRLSLERTAARFFGVDPARVTATAGVEAGVALLATTLGLAHVDIVSPTYGGHARAWASAGAVRLIDAGDAAESAAAGLVIVNPNNPDGRNWARDALVDLAARRSSVGLWTIVDEAFVEMAPGLSIATAEVERLVVLRSFGKFFGLPGARLGFIVGPPSLAHRLQAGQGDWPVGADAIALGRGAYADTAWADKQRRRVGRAAARLDGLLAATGFELLGGAGLFRLTASADAGRRFVRLCERGVLTRPFDHDPTWLRFGLPGPRDWDRLQAALAEAARC